MERAELIQKISEYPAALGALTRKLQKLNSRRAEILTVLYPARQDDEPEKEESDSPSLEEEVARLKIDLARTIGKVELDFRTNPPPGLKVTESSVIAAVRSNDDIVSLKTQLLAKQARLERQSQRDAGEDDGLQEAPDSPETRECRAELDRIEDERRELRTQLLELRTAFKCYRLLVDLYAHGALDAAGSPNPPSPRRS